jgi:hypothetical protein
MSFQFSCVEIPKPPVYTSCHPKTQPKLVANEEMAGSLRFAGVCLPRSRRERRGCTYTQLRP